MVNRLTQLGHTGVLWEVQVHLFGRMGMIRHTPGNYQELLGLGLQVNMFPVSGNQEEFRISMFTLSEDSS